MTKMEKLLDELKDEELEIPPLKEYERYLVPLDDKSVWKNRKKDTIVNEFYLVKFELWRGRMIERVFYVKQFWKDKVKHYYDIFEVQRFLAGCRYKLNRGIYQPSFAGTARPMYWLDYRTCEWEKNSTNTMRCEFGNNSYYYNGSIAVIYLNTYQKILKKSIHKYCGFEYSELKDEQLFWFLYQYEKHPQMEMIAKMGLMYIVMGSMNCLRWSQKGYKVLGIESKDELKNIEMCSYFGGLKYYRKHREDILKLKIKDVHELAIYDVLYNRTSPKITRKLINYIIDVDIKRGFTYEYAYASTSVPMYLDYLDFCNRLGIPMTSAVRYPEDLIKAHDELSNKIEILNTEEKTKKIQKQVINELSRYRYANDDYIITPANSIEDLINESKGLNHCVRTYADRYSKGLTSIFLIRKRDDVLTPFYTLELKDKKVRQVRGNHNMDPDENIRNFVTNWCKEYKLDPKIYQNY